MEHDDDGTCAESFFMNLTYLVWEGPVLAF